MFISYAQNFEDIMLWRALKHVEKGFYIDVGANDPIIDSVTKAFYDRGWQGINIEPIFSHFTDLQKTRPRDINLCCALGDQVGESYIWECEVRGWATIEKPVIENNIRNGISGTYHRVPLETLATICQEHVKGEIHFLKIDVEGFEKSVLAGGDFKKFRPWIIVVEATSPNTTHENYNEWEHFLTSANYQFAYADGLNRFYVSMEQSKLISALKYPPNVFDNFVLVSQIQAHNRAQESEELLYKTRAELHYQNHLAEIRALQLKAVYESSSWKITKPIRIFVLSARRILSIFKRYVKLSFNTVIAFIFRGFKLINKFPKLEQFILKVLSRLGIYNLIRSFYKQSNSNDSGVSNVYRFGYLSPRASAIYADLKVAINRQPKDSD